MFRFAVLLLATIAVAHTQTLLYPSSYRQISLPLSNSFNLSPQLQFVPLNPIYRFPSSHYQLHFLPLSSHQRQFIQTPAYTSHFTTQTRNLPLLWSRTGRSFGGSEQAHSGLVSGQPIVGQQPIVSPAAQTVIPPQSIPSAHSQAHLVGFVPGGAIVATPKVTDDQLALSSSPIAGQLPLSIAPSHHGISSVPVSYSVDLPKTQAPLASTSHISQLSSPQVVPTIGHHQESVGHHQVSHVTMPGQVGVGGGYSSAAFYETAPSASGVVIPSVPFSSQPIMASDVKVDSKAGQTIVDPLVPGIQQQPHHQTIGVQSF